MRTLRLRKRWFATVSVVLILFGAVYVFLGLKVLPVRRDVLLRWESALYGAIMVGWGVTLLLVGHIAVADGNRRLRLALMAGLATWLIVEAAASAWFGVWFNVGVDAMVTMLFAAPLLAPDGQRGTKR